MPGQKFHMGRAEWTNHKENCSEVSLNNPISMTTLGDNLIPFVEWPHTRSSNEMSIFHLGSVGGFSSSCWKLEPGTSWTSWKKRGYFSPSGPCMTEQCSWPCWSGWRNDCLRWILLQANWWGTLHPKSDGINPFWNRIIKWAPLHLVHPVESKDKF